MDKSKVGWALIIVFVVLLLGRVLGLPTAVILVSGRSMEPTLFIGDMVVAIKGSFNEGDIVIWCSSLTYCVIHRVINISGNEVILKGDNNPFPDPPINKSKVMYRVIAVIPRYVWLPPVIAVSALLIYRNRRVLLQEFEPGKMASITLALFVLFSTVIVFITPISSSRNIIWNKVPSMWLINLALFRNGTAVINYGMENTEIFRIDDCIIRVEGFNISPIKCEAVWADTRVYVTPPQRTLAKMYLSGINSYVLTLNITLTKGRLLGQYRIGMQWRKLDVNINSTTLTIRNPNPIPVNVSITYSVLLQNHTIITLSRNVTVDEFGTIAVQLPEGVDVRVTVKYKFMGEEIAETYSVPR